MIAFLAKRYVAGVMVFTAALVVLPILVAGYELREVLMRAVFWGGILAAGWVYWDLHRRKIWPLYDNFGLHRHILLGAFVGLNIVLSICLSLVLH